MGRLREIQEQMLELLEEAKGIVTRKSKSHRMTYERMRAYWHGHIKMGLTNEHEYLGSGGATLEDAVNDIEGDGDSLENLIEYAGDVDAKKFREEVEYDDEIPEGATAADIVKFLLEDAGVMDADEIRDAIDKAAEGESDA
jgi:hypothetical protein